MGSSYSAPEAELEEVENEELNGPNELEAAIESVEDCAPARLDMSGSIGSTPPAAAKDDHGDGVAEHGSSSKSTYEEIRRPQIIAASIDDTYVRKPEAATRERSSGTVETISFKDNNTQSDVAERCFYCARDAYKLFSCPSCEQSTRCMICTSCVRTQTCFRCGQKIQLDGCCRDFDLNGTFWVGASTTVMERCSPKSVNGKVVDFDADQETFTVAIGRHSRAGVTRALLHFDFRDILQQVKKFNFSAGVFGRLMWSLFDLDFSQAFISLFSGVDFSSLNSREVDNFVASGLLSAMVKVLENGGSCIDLPRIVPPYARCLLDLRVAVDALEHPTSALMLAAAEDCSEHVSKLLQLGISPALRAADGSTALHFAVENRRLPACRVLLEAKADPNAQKQNDDESSGHAPIHIAAGAGFVSALKLLLDSRADLNLKCGSGGVEPIHVACIEFSEATSESPKKNALLGAVSFLAPRSSQAMSGDEALLFKRMKIQETLAKSQHFAVEHFGLEMWQRVYCWMMNDEDLAYGQEGIVISCWHERSIGPFLQVEFAGEAYDFPHPTTNVKGTPPPRHVGGFRVGEAVFWGSCSEAATEVTILGPGSTCNSTDICIRNKDGDCSVVDAVELAHDRSSIQPFRALDLARTALCEANTLCDVLTALSRLTGQTRVSQRTGSEHHTKAKRLSEVGASRAADLSEADLAIQAEMRQVSDVHIATLRAIEGNLKIRESMPPPIPSEVAVKGGKFRLHKAGSLKVWLSGQLGSEIIHLLLLRAEWEPPSVAFPLLKEALRIASEAVEKAGDPEPFIEVYRSCTRRCRTERALYQPILHEAREGLECFLGSEHGTAYLLEPIWSALLTLSSPSFPDEPVPTGLALAKDARLRVDQVRRCASMVVSSIEKSRAGNASLVASLREFLDFFPQHINHLDQSIEASVLSALNVWVERPVRAKNLSEFKSAASQIAQLHDEVRNTCCRIQALSSRLDPSCSQCSLYEALAAISASRARDYKAMKSWPLARMREFFEFRKTAYELVKGCTCGFKATELANSSDCPSRGLRNHIDFPPASCLPCDCKQDSLDLEAVAQYYFVPGTAEPFRHWALVAQIESIDVNGEVVAKTAFDEQIRFRVVEPAEKSVSAAAGRTIVILYPTLQARSLEGMALEATIKKAYHISECGPDRVMIFNAKLDVVLKASDDLCAETVADRNDLADPYIQRFPCLLALVNMQFRVFLEYISFSSLRQRELSGDPPVIHLSHHAVADNDATELSAPAPTSGLVSSPVPAAKQKPKRKGAKAKPEVQQKAEGSPAICGVNRQTQSSEQLGACEHIPDVGVPGVCPAKLVSIEAEAVAEQEASFADSTQADGAAWMVIEQRRKPIAKDGKPGVPAQGRPGHRRIRPSEVFFTHDSIKASFSDGRPIDDTLQALRSEKISINVIPELTLSWGAEGRWPPRWWSYTGNRRLWVFRQLEEQGMLQDIICKVTDAKVPTFRLTTKDGGESVRVRGRPSTCSEQEERPTCT
mmetsp:Transcript_42285/g.133399  ORF Transcript_42285/g.133399 Transcript_42285/m.133399 type:complete len:1507 (+) Transcript_42285:67-4587(+)